MLANRSLESAFALFVDQIDHLIRRADQAANSVHRVSVGMVREMLRPAHRPHRQAPQFHGGPPQIGDQGHRP